MQSVKQNLLSAFRYLLKPLVRLAVKNGVSFPDFSDALKRAYVDVASRQIVASGLEVTEERVSLIANVEVNDVRGILQEGIDSDYRRAVREYSPLPTILAAWHTDPKYTGPYGVVLDLEFARSATSGDRSAHTFTDLAQTYCPGISPRVLVDELLRTGAVQDVGNGFYRAIKRSYIPEPLSSDSILNLARVVHNLCETLEVNLRASSGAGKGLIQRSIFTVHGMPKHDHSAFDKFIRERGQIFADDIDNWFSVRDVEGVQDAMQIGVGFFHYIVNDEDESALSKELPN